VRQTLGWSGPLFLVPHGQTSSLPTTKSTQQEDTGDAGDVDGYARQFYSPPASDASDLDKVNYALSRWTRQREHYLGLYQIWSKVVLFLMGKQWHIWNTQQQRWTPEKHIPRWRQRPETNWTFATFRTYVAKLTKQRPTFEVAPPSGDSNAREAARLSEAVLTHLWRKLHCSKLMKRGIGWLFSTSQMFVLVSWDPEAGENVALTKPMLHPLSGDMVDCPCDEDGEPITKKVPHPDNPNLDIEVPDEDAEPHIVAEGEVEPRLVSPLSIRYNPDARDAEEATEWYVGEMWPKVTAAETFGLDVDAIQSHTDDELMQVEDQIHDAAASANNMFGGWWGSDRRGQIGERVLVLRYYAKPSKDYPEGRHWIQVGKQMTPDGEVGLPYGFWPPLVMIEDVPIPGEPHGNALGKEVVTLNEQYNTHTGKIREHQTTMAMGGKYRVSPNNKHVKLTTDPGQVVVDKDMPGGGVGIAQIPLEPLPADVYKERDRIIADLQIISGMSEVAMGSQPEGTPSGRALLAIQESSDSVLGPTLLAIEEGWEEIGRRMLVLARKFYTEERTMRIRGENGEWEIKSFLGADLGDSVDVRIQMGSMFPWSKSAKLDTVIELLNSPIGPGLVQNPDKSTNAQKLAKLLDVGGISAFQSDQDPDLVEINREHAEFEAFDPAQGWKPDPITQVPGPPAIGFWQDMPKHFAEHCAFLKRDAARFEKWDPIAQKAFLAHVLQTQQAIQQLVQSMSPPQPPPGGPGGPPGPIPPPPGPGGQPGPGAGAPQVPPGAPTPPSATGVNNATNLQPSDFASARV